jgi:hypothetical protein
MARFPIREAEIKALAQNIIAGLTANPGLFPTPPVSAAVLQAKLDTFNTRGDKVVATRAAALQATVEKDAGCEDLTDDMKAVLRYAEDAVARDEAKLGTLGWSGRAAPVARGAELPGQPLNLEALRQGEGWVFLHWEDPTEGGPIACYKIERREHPTGAWAIVAMSTKTEATLNDQERRKDWEYRVIAVNKAGEGAASNTVAAVV